MKNVKVVLMGYYGAGNVGDELLCHQSITWLREFGAEVTVVTLDTEYTARVHGPVRMVGYYDALDLARTIGQADLFLLGGGGIFQDHHFGLSPEQLYRYPSRNMANYMQNVMIAQQFGVPVVLWAQGLGPLRNEESRSLVGEIYHHATHISLRDDRSRQLLEAIGVQREILVAPDPIFSFDFGEPERGIEPNRTYIGIVPRSWPFSDHWKSNLKASVDWMASYPHVYLRFINFGGGPDTDVIEQLTVDLDPSQFEVVNAYEMPMAVGRAFDGLSGVVAMRLHAQIAASCRLTPTVAIEYDEKVSSLSEMIDLPAWGRLGLDDSREKYIAACDALLSVVNREKLRPTSLTIERLTERSLGHKQLLAEIINGIQDRHPRKVWQAGRFDWLSLWFRDSGVSATSKPIDVLLHQRNELAVARKLVDAREQQITQLQSEQGRLRALVVEQEQKLGDQSIELAVSRKLVNAREKEIAHLKGEQARLRTIVAELERGLGAWRDETDKLKLELAMYEAQLGESKEALRLRAGEIEELRRAETAAAEARAQIESALSDAILERKRLSQIVEQEKAARLEVQQAAERWENESHRIYSLLLTEQHKRAAAEDSLAHKSATFANLERLLADSTEQLRHYSEKTDALTRENVVKEQERNNWEFEARALRRSTSWKITAPMRAAVEAARLFRHPGKATRGARFLIDKARGEGIVATGSWLARRLTENRVVAEARPGTRVLVPTESHRSVSRTEFVEMIRSAQRAGQQIFAQLPIIDWNVPLFQRPQHMATALARRGVLVIYPTSNHYDNIYGYQEVYPGVWVTNDGSIYDELDNSILSIYSTAHFTDFPLLDRIRKRNFLVYEYIDHIDEAISGDGVGKLTRLKSYCFSGKADMIVASANKLLKEAGEAVGPQRTCYVANGVDCEHYARALRSDVPAPRQIREFREKYNKIIGYFGAIAPWLWYDMINELTHQRPDLGFVFIGPDYYGGMGKLTQRENVLLTDAIPYTILPQYAREFDVAIIPFEPGEIAETTSPLKLFEYFALEKPVVVTDRMKECIIYPEVFPADSATGFSVAIDRALAIRTSTEYKERLLKLALANSWDVRAQTMLDGCRRLMQPS